MPLLWTDGHAVEAFDGVPPIVNTTVVTAIAVLYLYVKALIWIYLVHIWSNRSTQCAAPNIAFRASGWSADAHRHENLVAVALDEQRQGFIGLGHHRAHLVNTLDRRAVDSQQHVARLNAGQGCRTCGIFDQ